MTAFYLKQQIIGDVNGDVVTAPAGGTQAEAEAALTTALNAFPAPAYNVVHDASWHAMAWNVNEDCMTRLWLECAE